MERGLDDKLLIWGSMGEHSTLKYYWAWGHPILTGPRGEGGGGGGGGMYIAEGRQLWESSVLTNWTH